jgi:biopolymer transport protein ExbD
MRRRLRKKRRHHQQVASELELMPMLNVFITIIPLLLLSAAFVPVTVIQASLPAAALTAATPPADAPLELTIFIRKDAFVIEGNGVESRAIPRPAPGPDSDAARTSLSEALRQIVATHPENREVRIVAEATTRYEEIVDVMDVSRSAGLPEVSLAEAGEGAS